MRPKRRKTKATPNKRTDKRPTNRKNAKKSTGPKTRACKTRSNRNALKHGLRAEQIIQCSFDPAQRANRRDSRRKKGDFD